MGGCCRNFNKKENKYNRRLDIQRGNRQNQREKWQSQATAQKKAKSARTVNGEYYPLQNELLHTISNAEYGDNFHLLQRSSHASFFVFMLTLSVVSAVVSTGAAAEIQNTDFATDVQKSGPLTKTINLFINTLQQLPKLPQEMHPYRYFGSGKRNAIADSAGVKSQHDNTSQSEFHKKLNRIDSKKYTGSGLKNAAASDKETEFQNLNLSIDNSALLQNIHNRALMTASDNCVHSDVLSIKLLEGQTFSLDEVSDISYAEQNGTTYAAWFDKDDNSKFIVKVSVAGENCKTAVFQVPDIEVDQNSVHSGAPQITALQDGYFSVAVPVTEEVRSCEDSPGDISSLSWISLSVYKSDFSDNELSIDRTQTFDLSNTCGNCIKDEYSYSPPVHVTQVDSGDIIVTAKSAFSENIENSNQVAWILQNSEMKNGTNTWQVAQHSNVDSYVLFCDNKNARYTDITLQAIDKSVKAYYARSGSEKSSEIWSFDFPYARNSTTDASECNQEAKCIPTCSENESPCAEGNIAHGKGLCVIGENVADNQYSCQRYGTGNSACIGDQNAAGGNLTSLYNSTTGYQIVDSRFGNGKFAILAEKNTTKMDNHAVIKVLDLTNGNVTDNLTQEYKNMLFGDNWVLLLWNKHDYKLHTISPIGELVLGCNGSSSDINSFQTFAELFANKCPQHTTSSVIYSSLKTTAAGSANLTTKFGSHSPSFASTSGAFSRFSSPATPETTPASSAPYQGGISAGGIAGIVISSMFLGAVGAFFCVCCIKKLRKNYALTATNNDNPDHDYTSNEELEQEENTVFQISEQHCVGGIYGATGSNNNAFERKNNDSTELEMDAINTSVNTNVSDNRHGFSSKNTPSGPSNRRSVNNNVNYPSKLKQLLVLGRSFEPPSEEPAWDSSGEFLGHTNDNLAKRAPCTNIVSTSTSGLDSNINESTV